MTRRRPAWSRSASCALLLALIGCGSAVPHDDAGPPDDAAVVDAPIDAPVDAAIDAGIEPPPARSGAEITGAAGRLAGGGYQVDIQLGHPASQQPAAAGGYTVTGGALVAP